MFTRRPYLSIDLVKNDSDVGFIHQRVAIHDEIRSDTQVEGGKHRSVITA